MARDKKRRITLKELIRPKNPSRREFLKKIGLGSGGIFFFNGILIKKLAVQTEGKKTVYSLVVVDFSKCTGCRTCETVCSAFNHSEVVNEKEFAGLGNPYFSNIRVYPYNPDVDVPVTCLMCDDAPCLEACPVETDPKTGHRAIYREGALPILRNDLERCIGCGSCAEACLKKRVGAIIPNPQTHKPERMCTLCNGDPLCVKYCPYGALSYMVESTERKHYGFSPNQIAEALTRLWFNLE
jgi:carbon-monoxide dehydrogenase iron sulfur subunit